MAEYFPVYMKLRAVAFSIISFISLLWVILLSIELFFLWNTSSTSERALVVVLCLVNAITLVMLPVLILCKFRPFLDAARVLFLLTIHIGTAGTFAFWYPRFSCPTQTADQEGVCRLMLFYILMASWVVPLFLIAYAVCLAVMVYRRSRLPPTPDPEAALGRQSHIPIMKPEMGERSRSGSTAQWPTTPNGRAQSGSTAQWPTTPAVEDRSYSSRASSQHGLLREEHRNSGSRPDNSRRSTATTRQLPPWY
ncbi:hypothetical protein PLICRDRAFT_92338 [Plicaturopsis crispa FD-325 SS-3]|nr:hypothetical protein PLICRDRAFT_92338 [Plicaturopsis crispa FD-325 SS-3]